MIRILVGVTAFIVSCNALAAPKLITCTQTNVIKSEAGEVSESIHKWSAVLDTDDFKKENPEFEWTLLQRDEFGEQVSGQPVGNSYRYKYEVTPTTISLRHCGLFVDGACSMPSLGMNFMTTTHISRSDLSIDNGSCTIEDYAVKNVI